MAAFSYPVTLADGRRAAIDSDVPLGAEDLQAHLDGYNQQLSDEAAAATRRAEVDASTGRASSYGGTAVRSFVAPLAGMTRGLGDIFDSPTLVRGGNELEAKTATNFPANPEFSQDAAGKVIGTTAGLAGALPPFLVPGAGEALGPLSLIPQLKDSGLRSALATGAPLSVAEDYSKTHVLTQLPLMVALGRVMRNSVAGGTGEAATRELSPLGELGLTTAEAGAIGGASRFVDNLQAGPHWYNLDPNRGLGDDVLSSTVETGLAGGILGLPKFGYQSLRPPAVPDAKPTAPAAPAAPPPSGNTASQTFGTTLGGMMDFASSARKAFGLDPAAPPADPAAAPAAESGAVKLPEQPSFLPPLAGKSAADSGSFLEQNTLTSSDLTNKLYRLEEQETARRDAADERVNILQRIRANAEKVAKAARDKEIADALAEPGVPPAAEQPAPKNAEESANVILEAERTRTAEEEAAHADAAKATAAELLRQKLAAEQQVQQQQVVGAVNKAANTAAATEEVAPATAEALRQKAAAKVDENTEATPIAEPEAVPQARRETPVAEQPAPVADQVPVASGAEAAARNNPAPGPAASPAAPDPAPAPASVPRPAEVVPSSDGAAARVETGDTQVPESVPPASAAAEPTGEGQGTGETTGGQREGVASAEADTAPGEGQPPRMTRAQFVEAYEDSGRPGDANAEFDKMVAAGKVVPVDADGRPVTVLQTDPNDAMNRSRDVQAAAVSDDAAMYGADALDEFQDTTTKADVKAKAARQPSESYGSRTDEDSFFLPQEAPRTVNEKGGVEPSYVDEIAALPAVPGERAMLEQAHSVLQRRRYEVNNKVGGYEGRGGDDATARVLNAALLKYQRNLREGKSGKDGTFKPNEVGQVLNNVITDFQKGASKRKTNVALDAPVGEDGSATRGDLLSDEEALNPGETVAVNDAQAKFDEVKAGFMETLSPADRERLEDVLQRVAMGEKPVDMSADDIILWDELDEYASDKLKDAPARKSDDVERPPSVLPESAPGDAAPENAGGRGEGNAASESNPGEPGPRAEEPTPLRSEPTPPAERDTPRVPEGEERQKFYAGDKVRYKRRAAVLKSIDGDVATIKLKGSRRSIRVRADDLADPIRRSFVLSKPRQDYDIIDAIQDNGGGMLSPRKYRNQLRSGQIEKDGGEYDGAPGGGEVDQLPGLYHNVVFGGRMRPDEMASALADPGENSQGQPSFGDGNVETMWKLIDEAIRDRKKNRQQTAEGKKEEGQFDRFTKDTTTPTKARSEQIVGGDLRVGDEVKMGKEKLKVLKVDPDTGAATLEDGARYGRQIVEEDQSLYVEEIDRADEPDIEWPDEVPAARQAEPPAQPEPPAAEGPLPTLRRGENQGDLLSTQTEDLTLTGERGVDYAAREQQRAQAEREAEERRAQQDRDQLPLPGTETSGDLSPEHSQALDNSLQAERTSLERMGVPIREQGIDSKAVNGMAAGYDSTGDIWLEVARPHLARNIEGATPEEAAAYIRGGVSEEIWHIGDLLSERQAWEEAGKPGGFDDFVQHQKTELLNDIAVDLEEAPPAIRATLEGALLDGWNLYRDPNGEQKVSYREAKARAATGDLNFSFKTAAELSEFLNDNPERIASYMLETMRQLVQIREKNPGITTETAYVTVFQKFQEFVDRLLNRLRRVAADPKAYSPALADAIARVEAARRGEPDSLAPPRALDAGAREQRVDAPRFRSPAPKPADFDPERKFVEAIGGVKLPSSPLVKSKLPSMSERVRAGVATAKTQLGRAVQAGKELGNVKQLTDRDVLLNDLSANEQINAREADAVTRQFQKAVPDLATREAITVYVDAGGDKAQLTKALGLAKTPEQRARYEKALNLNADETKAANAVAEFYKEKFGVANTAGIVSEARDNYINRIIKQPFFDLFPDRAPGGAGSGGRYSKRFRFADERKFPTLSDVEQADYTPQTYDAAELMGIYSHELGRAMLTRDFGERLKEGKASDGRPLAAVKGDRPVLRPNATPAEKQTARETDRSDYYTGDETRLLGSLALHPEAARSGSQNISNVLKSDAISRWLRESTDNPFAEIGKGMVRGLDSLQGVIKETMFDLSPFHMTTEAVHATGHRINPFGKIETFDPSNPEHLELVKGGLMLVPSINGVNHFAEGLSGGSRSLVRKIPLVGRFAKMSSDFLFHSYIPSLKLKTASALLERNLKTYAKEISTGTFTRQDVAALSARQANYAYGHLNYTAMARNPTMQHVFRMAALAPDFLEARVKFTGQAAQGLLGRVGRQQIEAMGVLFLSQFVLTRIYNKTMDDDWHWDHPFSFVHGDRALTLRSVPEDIYKAVTETSKFIAGRESPYVRTGIQILTGRNYRGERSTSGDALRELAAGALPISLKQLPGLDKLSAAQRNSTVRWWEAALGAAGFHVGRVSPEFDVYHAANKFKESKGIKEDTGVYPTGPLTPIKYALQDGDMARAKSEIENLAAAGKTKIEIMRSLQASIMHPYTGSQAMDREFAQGLTGSDRQAFVASQQSRARMIALARTLITQLPNPPARP